MASTATIAGLRNGCRGWRFGALLLGVLAIAPCVFAQDATPTASAVQDQPQALPETFAEVIAALPNADFSEKRELVDRLVALHHPHTRAVLRALRDGALYSRASDKRVFIAEQLPAGLKLIDPITLADAGTVPTERMDKIVVNNSLRSYLRGLVAQLSLSDADRSVRLAAVREMRRTLDPDTIARLRARLGAERDPRVRRAIELDLAVADLDSPDANTRLAAVGALRDSLGDDVYNRLSAMIASGADGRPAEADPRVLAAVTKAIAHLRAWREFYHAIETLFFGLSLGSVLVLAAIGLAITFGVMGVINMAHGELLMLGAYTTYCVQQLLPNHVAASILCSIPAAFAVSGLAGVAVERGIVRFLYGRPLETLLATFGVSLFLQQAVRTLFSPLNRSVSTPVFMSGSLQLNEALSITRVHLYVLLLTALVFAALQLTLKHTALGLKLRAVAQNRAMAKAMGIRSAWIDAATFGLGSGVAGVAGVALSQLTNVGPNLGQSYIVDSFMVVVFGGVGNLWGTLIGGLGLGVTSKLLEPAIGAVMAKILVLVLVILFIQRRQQGLFPQKGRVVEGL